MIYVSFHKSTRRDKKYMVKIMQKSQGSQGTQGDRVKTIHFGAVGYSDFTKHKDIERKKRYDARHRNHSRHHNHEDWTIRGVYSAGFWAKWILWNKPSVEQSIRDVKKRFNIKITQ